ncbi:hypothetical protein PanWU01x14_055650 [Parasponia andersonii]|uniref:Uncharacterized protein n=1 Tax=Parasponia andersonii TaxID=3476 RepID=A0A2P5DK49_PARAD|nr:hypothetical protein PanWU01x14_055650 [Parasponia andersonii]
MEYDEKFQTGTVMRVQDSNESDPKSEVKRPLIMTEFWSKQSRIVPKSLNIVEQEVEQVTKRIL